jgi:hypothetical protein
MRVEMKRSKRNNRKKEKKTQSLTKVENSFRELKRKESISKSENLPQLHQSHYSRFLGRILMALFKVDGCLLADGRMRKRKWK